MGARRRCASGVTRRLRVCELWMTGSAIPYDKFVTTFLGDISCHSKFVHAQHPNFFRLSLPFDQAQQLLAAMLAAAPRKLKHRWSTLLPPAAVTFVCPRESGQRPVPSDR
jgi:hypothetical protein